MTNSPQQMAEERAKRVLFVRKDLMGLSRKEFCQLSHISTDTMQNWEQARNKGLTETGARRLIEACKSKHIDCNIEWLLYGLGSEPISPDPKQEQTKILKEEDIIKAELQFFHGLNHQATSTIVNDDAMAPHFWPGDYVAGKRYYTPEQIKKCIGLSCIIEIESGHTMVRLLETSSQKNSYNLVCINQNTTMPKVMENVTLKSVAPIVWIRKAISI